MEPQHHLLSIDPLWVLGALFTIVGIGIGWYIVRLDAMVESLRDEIIKIEKDIGSLKNADINCTRDQDILKMDMSHIRRALLKIVGKRFVRRSLRRSFRVEKRYKGGDE